MGRLVEAHEGVDQFQIMARLVEGHERVESDSTCSWTDQ